MPVLARPSGVTVIEVLIALGIAAVLLSSAVPAFRGALDRLRLSTTVNELVLAVNVARTEAAARRARVAILPRAPNDWASGWVVFIDANDNGQLDATETIVRVFDPVPPRMTIAAAFGTYDGHVLSFDPTGLLRRPGSNGMVLGRLTLTAESGVRTVCFSAASVRTVRAAGCV
jgi:type IV fimbrial biogenesis protein FimT